MFKIHNTIAMIYAKSIVCLASIILFLKYSSAAQCGSPSVHDDYIICYNVTLRKSHPLVLDLRKSTTYQTKLTLEGIEGEIGNVTFSKIAYLSRINFNEGQILSIEPGSFCNIRGLQVLEFYRVTMPNTLNWFTGPVIPETYTFTFY